MSLVRVHDFTSSLDGYGTGLEHDTLLHTIDGEPRRIHHGDRQPRSR